MRSSRSPTTGLGSRTAWRARSSPDSCAGPGPPTSRAAPGRAWGLRSSRRSPPPTAATSTRAPPPMAEPASRSAFPLLERRQDDPNKSLGIPRETFSSGLSGASNFSRGRDNPPVGGTPRHHLNGCTLASLSQNDPPVFPLPDAGGSVFSGTPQAPKNLRAAVSLQDAAIPHLPVDHRVILATAVAGRAPGVEVLVGARERVRGVLEPLGAGVEELRREVEPVHPPTAARVAPHELTTEVPQRRRPHLAHAVDVAPAPVLLGLVQRAPHVGSPAALPS